MRQQRRCNPRQRGLTLIELMVAMTLGLVLVAAVANLAVQTSRSQGELEKAGRQLENGRYALELLAEEIMHAGFYGRYDTGERYPGGSLPDPCVTADPALLAEAMPLVVQGYDGPVGAPPITCLSDADHVDGTDILVLRRTSTTATALGSLASGEVYLQSNFRNALVRVAPTADFTLTERDGSASTARKYRVDIYFVSPCRTPDAGGSCSATSDGGSPVPTLKRMELTSVGGTPQMQVVPLVDSIENLQIDYGIDYNNDGAPDASGGAAYKTVPASTDEWQDVVMLRLHLLARSPEPSTGYADNKSYDMGLSGSIDSPGDSYKRHVFTVAVRAVNRSSRREEP